jgi:hypothetical protein
MAGRNSFAVDVNPLLGALAKEAGESKAWVRQALRKGGWSAVERAADAFSADAQGVASQAKVREVVRDLRKAHSAGSKSDARVDDELANAVGNRSYVQLLKAVSIVAPVATTLGGGGAGYMLGRAVEEKRHAAAARRKRPRRVSAGAKRGRARSSGAGGGRKKK